MNGEGGQRCLRRLQEYPSEEKFQETQTLHFPELGIGWLLDLFHGKGSVLWFERHSRVFPAKPVRHHGILGLHQGKDSRVVENKD